MNASDPPLDRNLYAKGYRRHFRADDGGHAFHHLYEAKRLRVLEYFGGFPPLRVLDAGGGPGRLAAPLAERHDVTLCDISPEMLEEARTRCPSGVSLVQADAQALPFESGSFDAVLALDLLCHLPDLHAGVAEVARVVRPGGSVVIDTTNARPWWVLAYPSYVSFRPDRLVATLAHRGVLPEWRPLVRHDTAEEARTAIDAAGLTLLGRRSFGPRVAGKWHLWFAEKPAG